MPITPRRDHGAAKTSKALNYFDALCSGVCPANAMDTQDIRDIAKFSVCN
jgi:hypothetical protein